jgi:hypothetical protein
VLSAVRPHALRLAWRRVFHDLATHVGCSTACNKGSCGNRISIKRVELEERVLDALKSRLMDPTLFRAFCDEFTREMNRLRMEGRASLEAAWSEVERIDRKLGTLLDLILKGGAADRINARMVQLEARKKKLEHFLADATEPPALLHPEMATFYREQVTALHIALGNAGEADRAEAAERLRSLVSKIVLTPVGGRLAIDVHGDLTRILSIAHRTGGGATLRPKRLSRRQTSLPKAIGLPGSTADVAEIAQQVSWLRG